MKVMMLVGMAIALLGVILMPAFAISQKYVPVWILPLLYYGVALMLTSGLFARWKKWKLSKNGSIVLTGAGALTVVESVCVLIIALVPTAIFLGTFNLLSTLRY
jgi:hypothetical protein